MAGLQLPVAGDTAIAHPAVDRRDHLDVPRPVLRDKRPLDPRVVRVAHADEPAAVQRRFPAGQITETNVADDSRVPDVQFVAVTEQIGSASLIASPPSMRNWRTSQFGMLTRSSLSTGTLLRIVVSRL